MSLYPGRYLHNTFFESINYRICDNASMRYRTDDDVLLNDHTYHFTSQYMEEENEETL